MSEAKSLVVWKAFEECDFWSDVQIVDAVANKSPHPFSMHDYEYAHDLAGRFLGVFREVRA